MAKYVYVGDHAEVLVPEFGIRATRDGEPVEITDEQWARLADANWRKVKKGSK